DVESDQLNLMRQLRFKQFFISLIAISIETAIGKKCDPQMVAFSTDSAKTQSLLELIARWSPIVDTMLSLITAIPEAKEFGSRLSDEQFLPSLSKQINALLHAMGAAEKHKGFADIVAGT
ncbi:MAG: hypothetical protein U0942_01125, partial [Parvibaculum sp.]|uniref:hypothetical protein n=1 Tax=Parvibaculum sp. TaxID=2024848 RepID=UPI002ABA9221